MRETDLDNDRLLISDIDKENTEKKRGAGFERRLKPRPLLWLRKYDFLERQKERKLDIYSYLLNNFEYLL